MLNSILDNDFYKFTMQQAVIKLFPSAKVCYRLLNRGRHSFPSGFAIILKEAVGNMVG
ncbi:MAG: nicotinate phosphoribosyltransferase, partial [Pedobacter sp.]